MPERLTLAQARRVALAAQGFLDKPHSTPTMRTLQRTVERTGVLQVDSVNVLQRAHYMPLFSRMGPYDTELLRRAAERRPRRLLEHWFGGEIEASYRQLDNEDYSGSNYETALELDARYSRPWGEVFVGGEVTVGHDVFGESYSRVGAFIRF